MTAKILDVVVEGGIIRVKVEFSDEDIQILQYSADSTAEIIQDDISLILRKKSLTKGRADDFKQLIGSVVSYDDKADVFIADGPLDVAVKAILAARPIVPFTRDSVEGATLNVK